MTKSPVSGLTAAECARRTGLTVRALRVYERARLIKPGRSAKGWRLYGQDDLVRLNAIVSLRGLGLTLAQIRKAFGESPPGIAQVLDLQRQAWILRRAAADDAIALIQRTLGSLRSRQHLSIEELCNLLRGTDARDNLAQTRELINQHVTPQQEREWLTYWAQRPRELAVARRENFAAMHAVAEEFRALMQRDVDPASPEAQALVTRVNALRLQSGARQRQLELHDWNPEVSAAWNTLGAKLLARRAAPENPEAAERLGQYMNAARAASPGAQAVIALAMRARGLLDQEVPKESPSARELAADYRAACAQHGLGDPTVHARWVAAFADLDDKQREAWRFLADLLRHHARA